MTIDQKSELITKSLCLSSHHLHTKRIENIGRNLVYVYVLLGVLCFSTIAISTIFLWYTHHCSDDLSVLRKSLKNDLIVNDIKHIVRILIEDEYQPLYDGNTNLIQNVRKTYQTERNRREARTFDSKVTAQEKKFVEFFNPKIRRELEKKDEEFKKAYGYKGSPPGGDEWVWLTSYCRIPYESITGFCSATKEYCPAGPAGIPGLPGPKGYKGDIGMPGPAGKVSRGMKGMRGIPGIDGRDGANGEPGLDGVPGRAGADGKDGIPGKDGKDGIPGQHGTNGRNGFDGKEGPVGPPGRVGPPGEMGIAGPRGPTGAPGNNGTAGIPGINAWSIKVNGTISNEYLIPPSIVGADIPELKNPIIVHEGDNVRLRCAASGVPTPHVEWRIKEPRSIKTINLGAWQVSSSSGHTLSITKINRVHMGTYQCIADNGIPSPASAIFNIEVHFAPLIFVRNQYLYVAEGGSVTLECEVEAFPEPLQFWKRQSDNRVLYKSNKYKMDSHIEGYKSRMQLNITKIQKDDYGTYECVSKNEVNTTTAVIYVNDKIIPPNRGGNSNAIAIFGTLPPNRQSYEDICGPPTVCDNCSIPRDSKCKETVATLYDLVANLEIKHLENRSYGLFPNRKTDCVLYGVGRPVYQSFTKLSYGAWLKDPLPKSDEIGDKIWMTNESDIRHIYEFKNKERYEYNNYTKKYELDAPGFQGNAHEVYNGSFYYQEKNSDNVVRYDLEFSKTKEKNSVYRAAASGPNFLYTTKQNYMDFNVEENGLWVIYSTTDSNHTHVAKLDPESLEPQYSWNISVNHHKVGEMFIVSGVLYAIDSVTNRTTSIRLALDLYQNKLLDVVNLTFSNPFRSTTTVGYNHRTKELYTWDSGNQLTYPTRCHEIGYNISSSKGADGLNPKLQTGFDVYPAKKRN